MKKLFLSSLPLLLGACAAPYVAPYVAPTPTNNTTLYNTATYSQIGVYSPITTPIVADLDVSPTKITYYMTPSRTVAKAGMQNIINTAVREALVANGNADVMIAMEYQIKTSQDGVTIESVVITGYPARYTNFRNADKEMWNTENLFSVYGLSGHGDVNTK
uniref:hypothetical protein n=1 Tax=Alistipes sp. TaxID=1872444 RepID=UPI004055BA52